MNTVLERICSFLSDRTQQVSYRGRLSPTQRVLFGVPQGSVLGPMLCVLYTMELEQIVERVTAYVYICMTMIARCTSARPSKMFLMQLASVLHVSRT